MVGASEEPTEPAATPKDAKISSEQELLASVVLPIQEEFALPAEQRVSAEELDRQADRDERKELRRLRIFYAKSLMVLLVGQMIFMNIVPIFTGLNVMHINGSTMNFYLTGTLGEIFGIVTVAVKFLFSDKRFLAKHDS